MNFGAVSTQQILERDSSVFESSNLIFVKSDSILKSGLHDL